MACVTPFLPASFPSLTDSLQYLWVTSHSITLITTVCYVLRVSNLFTDAVPSQLLYRVSEVACVLTYTIVTYRRYSLFISFLLKQEQNQVARRSVHLSEILKTENFHLLAFSLLWCSTNQNLFKLLPFTIYSVLNLSSFILNDLIPEYQISEALRPLMDYLENPLLILAAHIDGLVFGILIQECIEANSYYALVLYSLIWGLRVESSEASRCSLYTVLTIIDYFVYQDYSPEWLKNNWERIMRNITTLIPLTTFQKDDMASFINLMDQFIPQSGEGSYQKSASL